MSKLSETQKQLREFKKRNAHMLGGITPGAIYQIWRDGYICGAIHGWYDKCRQLEKKRKSKERKKELRKKELRKKQRERAKAKAKVSKEKRGPLVRETSYGG